MLPRVDRDRWQPTTLLCDAARVLGTSSSGNFVTSQSLP
jgi:hypothetical protein